MRIIGNWSPINECKVKVICQIQLTFDWKVRNIPNV